MHVQAMYPDYVRCPHAAWGHACPSRVTTLLPCELLSINVTSTNVLASTQHSLPGWWSTTCPVLGIWTNISHPTSTHSGAARGIEAPCVSLYLSLCLALSLSRSVSLSLSLSLSLSPSLSCDAPCDAPRSFSLSLPPRIRHGIPVLLAVHLQIKRIDKFQPMVCCLDM
jgi:hypothetical protein